MLTADIDLLGLDWEPIDLDGALFDGRGHTISSLSTSGSLDTNLAGLFGSVSESEIKDLELSNVIRSQACNPSSTYSSAGALAGTVGGSEITNVIISGAPSANIGGNNEDLPPLPHVSGCLGDGVETDAEGESLAGGIGGSIWSSRLSNISISGLTVASKHASGGIGGQVDAVLYKENPSTLELMSDDDFGYSHPSLAQGLEVKNSVILSMGSAGGIFGKNGWCKKRSQEISQYVFIEVEDCGSPVDVLRATTHSTLVMGQESGGLVGSNLGTILNSTVGVQSDEQDSRLPTKVAAVAESAGGLVGKQGPNRNLGRHGKLLGYKVTDTTPGEDFGNYLTFITKPHELNPALQIELKGFSEDFAELNGWHYLPSAYAPGCSNSFFTNIDCDNNFGFFSIEVSDSFEVTNFTDPEAAIPGFSSASASEMAAATFSAEAGVFHSVVTNSQVVSENGSPVGGAIGTLLGGARIANLAVTGTKISCNQSADCYGLGGIVGDQYEPTRFASGLPTSRASASSLAFSGTIAASASGIPRYEDQESLDISSIGGIFGSSEFFSMANLSAYFDLEIGFNTTETRAGLANKIYEVGGLVGDSLCSAIQGGSSDIRFKLVAPLEPRYESVSPPTSIIEAIGGSVGNHSMLYGVGRDAGLCPKLADIGYSELVSQSLGNNAAFGIGDKIGQIFGQISSIYDDFNPALEPELTDPQIFSLKNTVSRGWIGAPNASVVGLAQLCQAIGTNILVANSDIEFIGITKPASQNSESEPTACVGDSVNLTETNVSSAGASFMERLPTEDSVWRFDNSVLGGNYPLMHRESLSGFGRDTLEFKIGDVVNRTLMSNASPLALDLGWAAPDIEISGDLPPGLSFANGKLLGIPSETGNWSISLTTSFGNGALRSTSPPTLIRVVASVHTPPSASTPTPTATTTPTPPETTTSTEAIVSKRRVITRLTTAVRAQLIAEFRVLKKSKPSRIQCAVSAASVSAGKSMASAVCGIAKSVLGKAVVYEMKVTRNKTLGKKFLLTNSAWKTK